MNLREHLIKLDKKQIEIIGNNLGVIDKYDMNKNFSKLHMIKMIINERLLNTKYIYELLDNKAKVKFDHGLEEDIKRITFGIDVKNEESIKVFKQCGFIFNGVNMPEDLRKIFINKYRKELIVNLEEAVLYNKHTPFLKLILVISKSYRNERGFVNTREISKYKYKKLIISYLSSKKLICIHDKEISLNLDNYDEWTKEKEKIIKDFYEYFFKINNRFKVKELLYRLISIQDNMNEWINLKKIYWVLEEYEDEFNFAYDIGLIIKAKDDEEYIQLNNEVLYMFHNDIYNKEEVVITPNFEIFISYKNDPLLIQVLNHFCKLKNKISDDDYYLIFDISKENIRNAEIGGYTYQDFLECLKTISSEMPDLVKEELIKISN